MKFCKMVLVAIALVLSTSVNATLVDRGNGLIFDTDLNITWLADANYAMTAGYDPDGQMAWNDAITWADQLQYAGYDNWRLPTALDQCVSGECDQSEMGHLHFIEFSGLRTFGLPSSDPDFALFNNTVQEGRYWSSTPYNNPDYPNFALFFQFDRGEPGAQPMSELNYAWAVADGDIGAVPVPAAVWLFGSGIIFLFGVMKRKNLA